MFKLIGDEQVVSGADNPLCLTTHRVRFEGRSWGQQSVDEIFLEDLSYQALRMSSRPLYLVLAGLLLLFALIRFAAASGSDHADAIIAAVGAVISAAAYAVTRRQVLILASSGGRIELAASSIPRETMDWFLLKLAEAKDRRFRGLNGAAAGIAAGGVSRCST